MKTKQVSFMAFLQVVLLNITVLYPSHLFSAVNLIAGSNQPAVGFSSEETYKDISNPVIGPSGHVAFIGSVAPSGSNAIWFGLPDQLEVIIKDNDVLTGFLQGFPDKSSFSRVNGFLPAGRSSFTYSSSASVVITEAGHVGFVAELRRFVTDELVGPIDSAGVAAYVNGKVYGILRIDDQAPGFSQEYLIKAITSFAFTDAGMVIQARVRDRNNNGSQNDRVGIWFWDFETLRLIPSPMANCDYLPSLMMSSVNINRSGEIVFSALLGGASCPSEIFGIFKWNKEKTAMVLAEGDPVPDMANTVFGLSLDSRGLNPAFIMNVIDMLSLNDQGEVSFPAILRDIVSGTEKKSVWIADRLNEVRLLSLEKEFPSENINNAFTLPFIATGFPLVANNGLSLVPVVADDASIMVLSGTARSFQPYANIGEVGASQLSPVLQLTDKPPGVSGAWLFNSFSSIAMNNTGQFIVSGAVVDENDTSVGELGLPDSQKFGIWRGTNSSDLATIAYDGMPFLVNGEKMNLQFALSRSISAGIGIPTVFSQSRVLHSSTAGGRATQLNDSGQIVFGSLFETANGGIRSGIFVTTDKNDLEEKLFMLAEQVFPDFFSPPSPMTQMADGFVFRFYPTADTYLGIKDGKVFVAGERFGSGIVEVDSIENVMILLEK